MIYNTIPVILYDNLLTFCDTGKIFQMEGDLLNMITNKNYNTDHASLSDKKLMYDFAKEKYFVEKALGSKNTRERAFTRLLKSFGKMVSASGVSTFYKKNFQKQSFRHLILMNFVID